MLSKFTTKELFDLSYEDFRDYYESSSYQNFLDYIEGRMRLAVLSLVRFMKMKDDVFFQLRKKTALSAYNKIQDEIVRGMLEFKDRELHLHDIIQDLVGCRIICNNREILEEIFDRILQIEEIKIDDFGMEFYQAPFRKHAITDDRYQTLKDIVENFTTPKKNNEIDNSEIRREEKKSNYESLHFYARLAGAFDTFKGKTKPSLISAGREGQKRRDRAEWQYIRELYESMDDDTQNEITYFPVEFQLRTITEHLWAMEEHRYVYSKLKEADPNITKDDMNVLSNAFIGLKFAYTNIDEMRAMVRKIVHKPKDWNVIYTGDTNDASKQRLAHFDENATDIRHLFDIIHVDFKDVSEIEVEISDLDAKREIAKILELEEKAEAQSSELYNKIRDLHQHILNDLDVEKLFIKEAPQLNTWGKVRMFLLLIAYLLLFSRKRMLTGELKSLLEDVDVKDIVGRKPFEISETKRHSRIFLAARIYEVINEFDKFTYSALQYEESKEYLDVFKEPLVGIRRASSLFLQSEFAGAQKAIEDAFAINSDDDELGWSSLKLAEKLKISEMYMRHAQYVWFSHFENMSDIVDNFDIIENSFKIIFSLNDDGFDTHLYRAYCWYYAVYSFLRTQDPLLPQSFFDRKKQCVAYLEKYRSDVFKDEASYKDAKIEVLLAGIPLTRNRPLAHENSINQFQEVSNQYSGYPKKALTILEAMANEFIAQKKQREEGTAPYTFISYSRKNIVFAKAVSAELRVHNLEVAMDEHIRHGGSILTDVESYMKGASEAIIIVSQQYFDQEQWVKQERAYLMDRARKQKLKLYIIVLDLTHDDVLNSAPLLGDIKYAEISTDITGDVNHLSKADLRQLVEKPLQPIVSDILENRPT